MPAPTSEKLPGIEQQLHKRPERRARQQRFSESKKYAWKGCVEIKKSLENVVKANPHINLSPEQTEMDTLQQQFLTLTTETASSLGIEEANTSFSIDKLPHPLRKPEEALSPHMDEELHNEHAIKIAPIHEVIMSVPDRDSSTDINGNYPLKEVNLTTSIQKKFDYYSRTRELEIDTPENHSKRVQILQRDVLDKLTEGTGIQTRVVIMRKGEDKNAMVLPDGTVFITQALLNSLDSLDEVAAVLAHEVTHLINKTTYNAMKDQKNNSFGVGWLHEAACDANAKPLLEKVGFNSLAFSTAILKVQGSARGSIHQSGLSRASQSVGQHMAIDSTTSNQAIQPIPDVLKMEVRKTNLEIINEITMRFPKNEQGKLLDIHSALRKLHPEDFSTYFSTLTNFPRTREVYKECISYIHETLDKKGFTKAEKDLFVFGIKQWSNRIEIANPEELVELAKALEITEKEKFAEMYSFLFDTQYEKPRAHYDSLSQKFMSSLSIGLYDTGVEQKKEGVPVTRQSIIDTMEVLQEGLGKDHDISSDLASIAVNYIDSSYLLQSAIAGEIVDKEQIKAFFEDCKDRNITFSRYYIDRYGMYEKEIKAFGEKIKISTENQIIVKKAFYEVFEIEEPVEKPFTLVDIDKFFERNENGPFFGSEFISLVGNLRRYFDEQGTSDQDRAVLLGDIAKKIDDAKFVVNKNISDILESGEFYTSQHDNSQNPEGSTPYVAFNMKLAFGLSSFQHDGPEFYQYLEKAMNESGINPSSLSLPQLTNLLEGVFKVDSSKSQSMYIYNSQRVDSLFFDSHKRVHLNNYENLVALPFFQTLLEKNVPLQLTSFQDLNDFTTEYLGKFVNMQGQGSKLFDDSLFTSIIGQPIQKNALELLQKDIPDPDLQHLLQFIDTYYPKGAEKTSFTRQIRKRILSSELLSFDEKVSFVVENFDSVGPEGMLMIAESIEDMQTYEQFRERVGIRLQEYLEGSKIITDIAKTDYLVSELSGGFDRLFETASTGNNTKKDGSTYAAKAWFKSVAALDKFSRITQYDSIKYDKEKEKYDVDIVQRQTFKSLHDIFAELHQLSPLQRFALVHKALTDQYGAFSSEENKRTLGQRLVNGLGLKNAFLAETLEAATMEVSPEYATFPISSMLGPLLFRSLDETAVDLSVVRKTDIHKEKKSSNGNYDYVPLGTVYSSDEIRKILTSTTRDITLFGAKYQQNPDSLPAMLTRSNDDTYHELTHRLQVTLGDNKEISEKLNGEVDPAVDAIIKGVESGGPLGIRALQLTSQFQKFSPAVERRLSDTFDRNQGLNKLLFWENLHKLSQENPGIATFVSRIKIHGYLGGGSLQTTYGATITDESGQERPIILKMKNPNIEAFIKETYSSAHRTLDSVSKKGFTRENRNLAKTGMVLIDLSQKWCLDDINDATFVQDDDIFKTTVDKFNTWGNTVRFYVPERVFTHPKVKSEDLATGETLNQVLKDENVTVEAKREVVEALSNFFLFQMKQPAFVDESGKSHYLVHSDPHVGNYIVDMSKQQPEVGVIDRSLYLKLAEEDIHVLEKLMTKGNNAAFVDLFTNRILDLNKVKGAQRMLIKGRVIASLTKEVAQQMTHGGTDQLALMRTLLAELSERNMEVPLNLRLMIRNIGAFQELAKRYDIDFDTVYKNFNLE